MANILKVEPQFVNDKAKEINTTKENMVNLLETLKNRITSMTSDNWVGDAGETYQNQFTLLHNQIIRALDTLQQHANNLSEAASRYAELETAQANASGNLDASSIFDQ